MACLLRQRTFEIGARGGTSMRRRFARIVRARTSVTATAAATSPSRIAVAPADSGMSAATSEQVATTTTSQKPRRQPACTTAMNGTARNSNSEKFDPPATTSSATNPIKPPHQRSSRNRPRPGREPLTPRDQHRKRIAGGRAQREPDSEPAVADTNIERKTGEHNEDRSPTDPVAELNRRKAEADF